MSELVEKVADSIEERMGPLFGSPEYLADPVKRARAEKRRREKAVSDAQAAIATTLDEIERHLSAVQYDPAPYTALKHRLAHLRREALGSISC